MKNLETKNKLFVYLSLQVFFWALIATTAQAITNGQTIDEKSPILDFTVATFSSNYETGEREACTGTLIEQQIVLTAAHCVVGDDVIFVTFGPQRGNIDSSLEVDRYTIHPSYKRDKSSAADLALLHLAKPAPGKFQPVELAFGNSISLLLEGGADIVLVGYGRSQITYVPLDASEHFSKREFGQFIKSGIFACDDVQLKKGCRQRTSEPADGNLRSGPSSINKFKTNRPSFVTQPSNEGKATALKGDSGGPALVLENGHFTQVGLASAGTEIASDDSPSVYTNVIFFHGWIEKEKNRLLNR